MKVKFYPERKLAKDGKSALWCYVREFKETVYLNTGQRIDPKLWDNDLQRANPRLTRNTIIKGELKSLNLFLDKFESKLFDIERIVRSQKPNASFSLVADEIKKRFEKKKEGFFDIYDEFLKIKRQEVSKQSLFKFSRLRSLLEDYQKLNRERLDFDKITPLFFSKFLSFLIEDKNMLNNTANKNIQFFKTFLIWANYNGYTENSSYKNFRTKTEESEIIYLTESELELLYNLELNDERLKRVRDIFVFQCYTGVRYSDIQNISKEDIQNSTWYLRTQKTHQIIEIPLNAYAVSILARYSEFPKPLPVISNQKMNKYLKELCEIAGIDDIVKVVKYKGSNRIETTYKKYEVIGTHTARRTFVSLSLQKGMKPESIMAITGHKTYRMMQRYLKIGQEHIRNEMEKAWGSNLRKISNN